MIDRFPMVATTPEQERKFPVGPESAKKLGYVPSEVDALPSAAIESFCGVGNPFSLGEPRPGQTVLDLGCGAGFDTLLAAQRVGIQREGHRHGHDARDDHQSSNTTPLWWLTNVEFVLGEIEALPIPDASLDLVISNGVFNLCPDKPRVLSEVFRVLKPGGRLQMADILLEPHVTPEEVASKGSWSD